MKTTIPLPTLTGTEISNREGEATHGGVKPLILCGTDFSANARLAAAAASVLAARMARRLVLVHAADEFNARAASSQELARFLQPVRRRLQAEAARLQKSGAEVGIELLHGLTAEKAIAQSAATHSPALVVVSAVSKTAFARWTLGSVSESVADSLATPTLVVRGGAAFEAWGRGERPLRVLVAVDSTDLAEVPLRWARELVNAGPCELTVAHLHRLVEERERLGADSMARTETAKTEREVLERDLGVKVRAQLGGERVRMVVEPSVDHPDARLITLAIEAKADVIVVGTGQRSGLEILGHHSVWRGILRHAPMSVVCVPVSPAAPAGVRIPKIQRVLVATDFSALADRAVPHAYSLAPEGGAVWLIHVMRPMRWPSVFGSNVAAKVRAAQRAHAAAVAVATARLRALIPNEAQSRGIATEVHVVESRNPARAIYQTAERFGAEVICLGSHGRAGLSGALVGSVTRAVMQQTRRPVFVVRGPAK